MLVEASLWPRAAAVAVILGATAATAVAIAAFEVDKAVRR